MFRKTLLFLASFLIITSLGISKAQEPANAQRASRCTLEVHANDRWIKDGEIITDPNATDKLPVPADSTDEYIVLNIDTNGELQGGQRYWIIIDDKDRDMFDNTIVMEEVGKGGFDFYPTVKFRERELWSSDGWIRVSINARGNLAGNNLDKTFKPGSYDIKIVPEGNKNAPSVCPDMSFEIKNPINDDGGTDTSGGNYCSITLDPANGYKNSDKVKFKVTFAEPGDSTTDPNNTNHKHRVKLRYSWGGGDNSLEYTTKELIDGVELPKNSSSLTTGGYFIEVFQHAHGIIFQDEGEFCTSAKFEVGATGGGLCEGSEAEVRCGFRSKKPLSQPCRDEDNEVEEVPGEGVSNDINHGCTRVKTALGYVGTSATGFTKWLLGFVLGIAGGILIIIIIIAGYRLMTSQGDPEKVKNAREQVSAAILGLLFIIFSLVILQFITDDILQLPGFGR